MILKFSLTKSVLEASEGSQAYQRMISLESFDQNGDLQKDDLHEVPHFQSLLCTIHGSFLKVKLDTTRSKRSANNSKKLVDPNGQFFSLVIQLLAEKKSNLFLSPVLDQWIEKLWAQGLKSQRLDFKVYINIEDTREAVGTLYNQI